ncbi:MAG TPA: outer membrane beta-barrel protein [Pseudohongiella sp.]|nr:outer membrane beta-barrel protein [Pseudohongiella sp.]
MITTVRKTFVGFGLVAAVSVCGAAQAQQASISYDYVEAGVTKGEILNEDFTGYGIGASFSINDYLFAQGSFSSGSSDDKFLGDKIDLDGFSFGLGYHRSIGAKTDLVASANYINQEVDFLAFNEDANGYGLELGIRSLITSNAEFEAKVNYVDGSDFDGEFGFEANVKLLLTPKFAVTLGYADGDDTKGVTAGLRFNF